MTRDEMIDKLINPDSEETEMFLELALEHSLSITADFEQLIEMCIQQVESADDYDDSMDGDHESALASAGFGTDEDYGYYGDNG